MRPLLSVLMVAALIVAEKADGASSWVATWACSPQLTEQRNMPPEPGLASNTLRQIFRIAAGGKTFRAHFSNAYGREPVTILAAHVAKSEGRDAIDPKSDKSITFQGLPSLTIATGAEAVSDPIGIDATRQSSLAVTIEFGHAGVAVTGHPGSRMASYLKAGDAVSAPEMPGAAKVEHWYILTGLDVAVDKPCGVIVTLGDSLTDGRGSTTDGNNRWPDILIDRLATNATTVDVSLVNAGIGGNTIVAGGLGPTALKRFNHDALAPAGARWVILFEGVNDVGGSDTNVVARIIAADKTMIDKARGHGLKIFGATITPFGESMYDSPQHEAAREAVNAWIREGGSFDAVIDFDAGARDAVEPRKLRREYDSGDHLHLNPAGYRALADAVRLDLFKD